MLSQSLTLCQCRMRESEIIIRHKISWSNWKHSRTPYKELWHWMDASARDVRSSANRVVCRIFQPIIQPAGNQEHGHIAPNVQMDLCRTLPQISVDESADSWGRCAGSRNLNRWLDEARRPPTMALQTCSPKKVNIFVDKRHLYLYSITSSSCAG